MGSGAAATDKICHCRNREIRMSDATPRMGRINFLNVLPIYHPLETGIIPVEYELVSGPPALLNEMMRQGQLHVSSCSCIEYARSPDQYYLVDDLAIGSRGPVMSVLLMSSLPFAELAGREILISGQSHTSVALLKLLLKDRMHLESTLRTANISAALGRGERPSAFLAIGDEALRLRSHPDFPFVLDLAEAWREWTGLPFIFGLWVIGRKACETGIIRDDPGEILRAARDWGLRNMDVILDLTERGCPLNRDELRHYYTEGLAYNLQNGGLDGLRLFYDKLARAGIIDAVPEIEFYSSL